MRLDKRSTGFWLPLAGGLAIAASVVCLVHRESDNVAAAPPPAGHPAMELSCGPFVDSFAAMRAEADRIATLAASTAVPFEEPPVGSSAVWKEVASAATALDAWVWEAQSQKAPLTPQEAATVSAAIPLTSQIRAGAASVAEELVAGDVDPDALSSRMEQVARTAATVARQLEPLAICDAQLSYAPEETCETGLAAQAGKIPCR